MKSELLKWLEANRRECETAALRLEKEGDINEMLLTLARQRAFTQVIEKLKHDTR